MALAATPFGLSARWLVTLWMMLAIVSTVGVKASCDHRNAGGRGRVAAELSPAGIGWLVGSYG
jgi:hypothetical protein